MISFEKINLFYFSATGTTKRIISAISQTFNECPQACCNLLDECIGDIPLTASDLAVIAVPVYSGRVPQVVLKGLNALKGNNTPVILIAVYGNRAFEDALVELHDIVVDRGFTVISAAAFIAQHAIFPKVATGRPNAEDLELLKEFVRNSIEQVDLSAETSIDILGNRPYRAIKNVPLAPRTNTFSCNMCWQCVKKCPTEAITPQYKCPTDKSSCIACGLCISVCPKKARSFGGLLYWLASKKFTKAYAAPQQPYMVYRK